MANEKGYYQDQSSAPLTGSFVSYIFGVTAGYLMIQNDDVSGSGHNLLFSWDGSDTDGTLVPGAKIEVQDVRAGAIYLANSGGAPNYRLIAIQY